MHSLNVCKCARPSVLKHSFSDPGRGDDDESVGRQEGDGDEGRVMEQDLVEGSVSAAAAAALASAATKAKVKLAPCNSCYLSKKT